MLVTFSIFLQQIAFTGVARLMMQMNSCANPFVYASTIPSFKQIAKDFFTCNIGRRTNEEKRMRLQANPNTTTSSHTMNTGTTTSK